MPLHHAILPIFLAAYLFMFLLRATRTCNQSKHMHYRVRVRVRVSTHITSKRGMQRREIRPKVDLHGIIMSIFLYICYMPLHHAILPIFLAVYLFMFLLRATRTCNQSKHMHYRPQRLSLRLAHRAVWRLYKAIKCLHNGRPILNNDRLLHNHSSLGFAFSTNVFGVGYIAISQGVCLIKLIAFDLGCNVSVNI